MSKGANGYERAEKILRKAEKEQRGIVICSLDTKQCLFEGEVCSLNVQHAALALAMLLNRIPDLNQWLQVAMAFCNEKEENLSNKQRH